MGKCTKLIVMAAIWAAIWAAGPVQAQLVIGHRGAAGERPEHTLAAYDQAINDLSDYIEPDLEPTKDGFLVARHEDEITNTTDVSSHAEFARRKKTRVIDGDAATGWFTEDFTLAELRRLRAKEPLPEVRPANARFDGLFQIPTFAEIAQLLRARNAETGRLIGLYPEIKHPAYYQTRGFDVAAMLLAALKAEGLDKPGSPIFIQCFEVGTLKRVHALTALPLVQLVESKGGPQDRPGTTFAGMMTPPGLKEIATYAAAIGVDARLVIGTDGKPTSLVADAHAAGLKVHVWTLRRENRYLPLPLRRGIDPNAPGDFATAWRILKAAGVDGVFTDNPGSVPRP